MKGEFSALKSSFWIITRAIIYRVPVSQIPDLGASLMVNKQQKESFTPSNFLSIYTVT